MLSSKRSRRPNLSLLASIGYKSAQDRMYTRSWAPCHIFHILVGGFNRLSVQETVESYSRLLSSGVPGSHVVTSERRVAFGFPVKHSQATNTLHPCNVRLQIGFSP